MTENGVLKINNEDHVTIKTYLSMPECCWRHRKTIEDKIHEEGFPAVKRGRFWFINLKKADLWFKRRDQVA